MNAFLSVGIDIGTTTTQLVFSRIVMQNTAASCGIPRMKITDKTIIYKSKIYYTPLISSRKIDSARLMRLITAEYCQAGVDKRQVTAGAIIITGETARRENAEEVLQLLSGFAGDFVVAAAGPKLEAVLAGCGAGANDYSRQSAASVINFDIGGGTTNAAVFSAGKAIDSFALDIGGRLIRFGENGEIAYISPRIKPLLASLSLDLSVGHAAAPNDLRKLVDCFAQILLNIYEQQQLSPAASKLFIGAFPQEIGAQRIMFSGGVAEYIYHHSGGDDWEESSRFRDIGPLLGNAIRKAAAAKKISLLMPKEKIRATVIGAGSHSLAISGSTIVSDDAAVPLKNIPIIRIAVHDLQSIHNMYHEICERQRIFADVNAAIAFAGPVSPSYGEIQAMASAIVKAEQESMGPLIIIVEHDFAKALGQTVKKLLPHSKSVICIDGICAVNGNYVDIGKSIAGVVPVVIKTLIF